MGRPADEIRGKFGRSEEFTVIRLVIAEAVGYAVCQGRQYVGAWRQPRREGAGKAFGNNNFQCEIAWQSRADRIGIGI